ncbi:MAG: hypothetical protein PHT07_20710 [Paludibacter sp.]|nr:hypothetical protein [Paludibacter sp.]
MKTLLQIVQSASAEMGLTVPTQVVGNTDTQIQQLYYLLNGLGDDLRREFPWEALNKSYRFTTQFLITTGNVTLNSTVVTNIPSTATLSSNYMLSGVGINQDTYISTIDSPTQVTLTQNASASGTGVALNFGQTIYPLPSDFDRQIDRTHYDKSKRWEMLGPETPQQWEFLKSSYISTGPRIRYRFSNGKFEMWPNITTAEYLGYEYVSNGWVNSAASVAQSSFLADTDTCIFPDRLMITGLKMKFFEVKGFDTTGFYRDYMNQLQIAKPNDGGSLTLSMAPKASTVLIGFENIPDGSIYGQG